MSRNVLKVVKIGGQLLGNEYKLNRFLEDFVQLSGPKILVHGGGIYATDLASKLGILTTMHQGRRITDQNTMEVISLAYSGLNKQLVAKLQGLGCGAIGLSGADAGCMISEKRPVKEVDYGFVGDIVSINADFLASLLESGITPVFSALSCTSQGQLLNTNADSVTSELALALSTSYQTQLYFCLEKKGVLKDVTDDSSVIAEINFEQYQHLKSEGIISEGMLPKLHNCFRALESGINSIFLGNETLLQPGTQRTKITT